MRVTCKRIQVADAVHRAPRLEHILKRERRERRVSPCAPAVDRHLASVDEPLLLQIAGSGAAVLDVLEPPLSLEALPVCAAVSRGTRVVDVGDSVASARPELDPEIEGGGGGGCGAAVALDQQRR